MAGLQWKFLQKKGANIWACARSKDVVFEQDMRKLSQKYGVLIWPVYFDATNDIEMKTAIQVIKKSKLEVHSLVNLAGIADVSTSFLMTSCDKIKHVFDVNFSSMTFLTQYVSRIMIRQNSGSIVNIASIAGLDGRPGQYEYVGSKAAMIGTTKELARELGQYNIRVNAIANSSGDD